MARQNPNQHLISGSYRSTGGSLTDYDQINKNSDDSDNDVIQSDSNDVKAMFNDVTTVVRTVRNTLANGMGRIPAALQRFIPYIGKTIGIANVINPQAEVASTDVVAGTANHFDLDFSLSGAARQKYKADNLTIDLTNRVITGVDPDDQGFMTFWFDVDASVNQVLLTLQDQGGNNFTLMRVQAGKPQYDNRLLAVADTDTARHNHDIPRQTGQSDTITGTNQSIAFDLPTSTELQGTGTLQMDSFVELHFNLSVRDRGTELFNDRISIDRPDTPASSQSTRWDDTTNGWVDWTHISIPNHDAIRIQYRISGNAGARIFTWRVNPSDASILGDRFTLVNTDHYAVYYLNNGRAATDQWTNFTSIDTAADTAKFNALSGSSADYKFGLQIHPEGRDASGHSTLVPGVILGDGTRVEMEAVTLSNIHAEFGRIALGASITNVKGFTNNFETHLVTSDITNLLTNHFNDEYALGYAHRNVQGTETEVAGDASITGGLKVRDIDITDIVIKTVGGGSDQYSPQVTSQINNISGQAVDTTVDYSTDTTTLELYQSTSGTSITNNTKVGDFTLSQINALPATYTAGGDIYTRQEDLDDGGDGSNANAISFTTGGMTFYLLKGTNGNIWVFLVNASSIQRYFVIRTPGDDTYQAREVATTDAETVTTAPEDSDFLLFEDATDNAIKKVTRENANLLAGALLDYTFNVIIPTDSEIVNNCYVVQPEDHGQLIALDPKATVLFCILPNSLWTTEYNFKVGVMLDAAPNGLVRIAVPHFIGRPNSSANNGPSLVKQNNTGSGLPTALRYPDNSAAAVNYIGYDYMDLWHARDWVELNMVNSAGWCGIAIKNLERNNPPQNPSNGQQLEARTTSFSASITNPTRTIAVTKFLQAWDAA